MVHLRVIPKERQNLQQEKIILHETYDKCFHGTITMIAFLFNYYWKDNVAQHVGPLTYWKWIPSEEYFN